MATFALVTTVGPQPRPARSTSGVPGRVRTAKLVPAFLTRLIDKSYAIRMSGGQVSSCQRAHARAPPFGVGDTRACFS